MYRWRCPAVTAADRVLDNSRHSGRWAVGNELRAFQRKVRKKPITRGDAMFSRAIVHASIGRQTLSIRVVFVRICLRCPQDDVVTASPPTVTTSYMSTGQVVKSFDDFAQLNVQ